MGAYQARISGVSKSPTELEVTVRQFTFSIDEPPALGGTDSGPNPVELILSSIAGCINVVLQMVAKERGVEIRGLKIAVTGQLDTDRLMGKDTDLRAGFESIELAAEVDSPASAEEIDELLRVAETRCPVADNLGNPTPVTLRRA